MAVAYHHLVEHPIGKDSELELVWIGDYQNYTNKDPESSLNKRVTGGYVGTSRVYILFAFCIIFHYTVFRS